MICKKCSTENPENAVFCQHCGKRLDGKIVCPSCNTLNDEEANFCFACGKKLTDAKVCGECGEVYHGSFCPKCGSAAAPAKPVKPQKSAAEPTEKNSIWRKVLEYVAGGLCMAAVFFALLFTFFIGSGINSAMLDVSSLKAVNVSIFDYFGNIYESSSASLSSAAIYDSGS